MSIYCTLGLTDRNLPLLDKRPLPSMNTWAAEQLGDVPDDGSPTNPSVSWDGSLLANSCLLVIPITTGNVLETVVLDHSLSWSLIQGEEVTHRGVNTKKGHGTSCGVDWGWV